MAIRSVLILSRASASKIYAATVIRVTPESEATVAIKTCAICITKTCRTPESNPGWEAKDMLKNVMFPDTVTSTVDLQLCWVSGIGCATGCTFFSCFTNSSLPSRCRMYLIVSSIIFDLVAWNQSHFYIWPADFHICFQFRNSINEVCENILLKGHGQLWKRVQQHGGSKNSTG